jgi:Predicted sugar kinase
MFKNIGVVIKAFNNPSDLEIDSIALLMSTLCKHFSNVYINEQNINFLQNLDIKNEDFSSLADLVVVIGGDGTLLGAARKYHEHDLPILGINMGTVGFLTEVTVNNFEEAILSILKGDYVIEDRSLISASFENTVVYALNEIVIHSGSYTQLMRYKLDVNSKAVYERDRMV